MRTLWNSMNETKETLKIAVVLGKQWLMDSNNSFERLFIHTSKQKKKTKNQFRYKYVTKRERKFSKIFFSFHGTGFCHYSNFDDIAMRKLTFPVFLLIAQCYHSTPTCFKRTLFSNFFLFSFFFKKKTFFSAPKLQLKKKTFFLKKKLKKANLIRKHFESEKKTLIPAQST